MYYADLRKIDSANGTGVGTTLFVSGCNFHCKNCFNYEAWNFQYGKPFTKEIENTFIEYAKSKYIDHISLLGGEVFHQDLNIILKLVKRIKQEVNKPIYVWSGFTFEELLQDESKVEILKYIDILTDGRFEEDKKNLMLSFKGSSNQRTINIQESLKQNKVVLYEWK